jgi:NADH-quinone oxidoreductase subunit G
VVDRRLTLILACDQAGVEVPRFCFHVRLSIADNCRMCLVEVVGGPPKPAASCAMHVRRDVNSVPAGRTSPCRATQPNRYPQ